jgi:RNA polymerase sigma factor (sigma-70 family)
LKKIQPSRQAVSDALFKTYEFPPVHPDQRYIQALLDNHHPLIVDIYTRFTRRVERLVCTNSGTSSDAADVLQEALVAITRQARRPEGLTLTCPFEAYLLLVCRGKWLNELERRRRSGVTFTDPTGFNTEAADPAAHALAHQTLLEAERDRLFWHHFERLPESCRQLLRLAWSGRGMQEVAELLQFTYAYARKRKAECVAHLTASVQASPGYAGLV